MLEHVFDLDELVAVYPLADEAALIGQIGWLERLKSAAAAAQARAAAAVDAKRRAAEAAAGVPKGKQGCGLASEVALARHDSPSRGGRHVGFAKALVHEMPHTLAALECGALSEWRATLIVRESACLSVADRRVLDAELCAEVSRFEGMGDKRITARAKEIAYRLDAQAVVDRAAKAEADRTVTIRPAPDCMTYLSVLLPVAKGVGVYAALKRAADTTFDDRSRGQVPEPVDVVISDERSKATLRRLYRHPKSGALVAMESRSRCFPKGLANFIGVRDRTCRTPYCDAPIRHRDHAQPHNRGGPTSAANGLGECEQCNYAKEAPGWQVTTAEENHVHTAEFVTPTGARYRSTAPPLPGTPMITISELEVRIGIDLADLHAA